MRLLLAVLFGMAAANAQAGLLAEFSCSRPGQVDEGTWHNVSLAAALLNGTVVPGGSEFSFIDVIEKGKGQYKPGSSFSSGRVVKSLGGGYCQVSTGLYNAVLLAGLMVLERYPHSFYYEAEAYVPPGRDAAVSRSSGADFRFLNSYSSPITITAAALDGRVSIEIYGAASPRQRWISTEATRLPMHKLKRPHLPQRPGHDGWVVKRWLHVLDAEGNTKVRSLGTDRYNPVVEYE